MLISTLDSTLKLLERSSGRLLQTFKSPEVCSIVILYLIAMLIC
jgi:hypothetical protein